MNLEQCTSLPVTAGDSLPTSSWDTRQLSLLSGMDTPVKSCESVPPMDGFQACECGKGTFGCSIHPSTRDKWIAFMRDSLAQTLALPEIRQGLARKHVVAYTAKSYASLAWFDQRDCSWKTSQTSFLTDSGRCSVTWPRSGMTANGFAYELPTVEPATNVTAGGLWPTPVAHDAKKGAYPSEYNRKTPGIAVMLGGKPSPTFQEWQMGWPINHTALKGLEMGKSRCKQPQPGESSVGLELEAA